MQENVGDCGERPQNTRTNPVQVEPACSGDVRENENPGALAGATGADLHSWLEWIDLSIQRELAARSLMEAVLACDPRDRIPLMGRFIEAMRPGAPIPAFGSIMAEAAFWADMASTTELKAYAIACYSRMSHADQAAFLAYVQGRAAA